MAKDSGLMGDSGAPVQLAHMRKGLHSLGELPGALGTEPAPGAGERQQSEETWGESAECRVGLREDLARQRKASPREHSRGQCG